MSSCTDSPSFDVSASRTSLLTVTRSLSVVSMVLVMVFTSATFGGQAVSGAGSSAELNQQSRQTG
ncbi:hypothetical protein KBZ19_00020 [Synechococcus sp. L2F]|jgi:hypothetical protein|uniref:hypothetical protein n=1 Tax=Synechococcus sp. L2F TaxID=2823739 RepID=UPI0020CD1054|nr:hypothetical protein [Synechococcus sp. L2F]MCP9826880.1 hypothetical protein [Synechococcus sp. L2F]